MKEARQKSTDSFNKAKFFNKVLRVLQRSNLLVERNMMLWHKQGFPYFPFKVTDQHIY